MDSATDIATGIIVGAAQHAAAHIRRAFRCPVCRKDVLLVVGEKPKPYFRHRRGVADANCENYQVSNQKNLLPRPRSIVERGEDSPFRYSTLYFDIVNHTPTLYEWLPPASSMPWTGEIAFRARNSERTLRHGMLLVGKRIAFALSDGRWGITVLGEVDPDYQSRISVGSNSLDADINVFDATRSPGRVVLPRESVTLGDHIWIVTRSGDLVKACYEAIEVIENRIEIDGWTILLARLPDTAVLSEISRLETLLSRTIREQPAKVWIESPWPWRHMENGIPEYFLDDAPLTINSSQAIDLEIVSLRDMHVYFTAAQAREAVWLDPFAGVFVIRVNDTPYSYFAITTQAPYANPVLRMSIDGAAGVDFTGAQQYVDTLVDREVNPRSIRMDWSEPLIGAIITVNGKHIDHDSQQFYETAVNFPVTISAENLGQVFVPTVHPANSKSVTRTDKNINLLALWLLSVASPRSIPAPLRIVVPDVFGSDELLQQLVGRNWNQKYVAHVRHISRLLRERS